MGVWAGVERLFQESIRRESACPFVSGALTSALRTEELQWKLKQMLPAGILEMWGCDVTALMVQATEGSLQQA